MKNVTAIILFLFLSFSLVFSAEDPDYNCFYQGHKYTWLENTDIDVDGSIVIITFTDHNNARVEISDSGILYINGEKIKTDKKTRKLLKEYNHRMIDLVESAEKFGKKCAQLGKDGVEIGLSAFDDVLDCLVDEMEWKALEEELKKEADRLEKKAEKLETEAEELEEMADKLESLHVEIFEHLPELKDLE